MSSNLIGHFYFKKTASGNLIGEFSNNNLSIIQSESADADSQNNNGDFTGKYKSTWLEKNTPELLILEIKHKFTTKEKIFTIKWSDKKGNLIFSGEGFIVDDILIGNYRGN